MKAPLKQRLILVLAALILLPVFISPVWSIRLVAPQYSDGLGMYIGVSEVWGHDTHDIQNINILNHYIGMRPIEPDAIPELDIFPPVLVGIILTGLAVALIGRRWLMTGWLVVFVGLCVAGMVDFYLWMIDYGHNLDPTAPIKIPGMTYTPPLIGTKQLLNITASSYPHIGSAFLGASLGLAAWGVLGCYRNPFRRRESPSGEPPAGEVASKFRAHPAGASRTVATLAGISLVLFVGCTQTDGRPAGAASMIEPAEQMQYGLSEDPYCGGLVETVRWGGEIRTTNGDTLRFRSVECVAAFVASGAIAADHVAEIYVVDFPTATGLIPAGEAIYLHTPNLKSPARRDLHVMAIGTEKLALSLQEAYTGPLMGWDDVLALVAQSWDIGAAGTGG